MRNFGNGLFVRLTPYEDDNIKLLVEKNPFTWSSKSHFCRSAVAFYVRHLVAEAAAKHSLEKQ